MKTLADKIIAFNKSLSFTGKLPGGVGIMNPFREHAHALEISSAFYKKYYDDTYKRHLVLGINPGRHGAGFTGIPFTDTKRLQSACGIKYEGRDTHEPSSVFIYEMIQAYGGPEKFYRAFYINSVCPLGFTAIGKNRKEVNYNYYDSKELTESVYGFIVEHIKKQIMMGVETEVCFCFGTGKNEQFLRKLNDENHFFQKIAGLEHPRFIMQYKARQKQVYIDKYIETFSEVK